MNLGTGVSKTNHRHLGNETVIPYFELELTVAELKVGVSEELVLLHVLTNLKQCAKLGDRSVCVVHRVGQLEDVDHSLGGKIIDIDTAVRAGSHEFATRVSDG